MKKKIAIVITRLDLGGAQKTALHLARNLDRKKFEVHLIAGKGGYLDPLIENRKSKIENVHFYPELKHPISPVNDIMCFLKLRKLFRENNFDIVHTHSSKAGILGRLAAKAAGVPKIIHTIHGFSFHEYQNPLIHLLYLMAEKAGAAACHKLIAVGQDVLEYGLKKGIGSRKQYEIIRPGIDMAEISQAKGDRKKFLKTERLHPTYFTVGMIGNLKPQKNPLGFVEIADKVCAAEKKVQFVFAGDGPLKRRVMAEIERRHLEDRVRFIGWTDKPGVFLKAIDLFVLTSLWEGLPCTLAQAAAAGKPCVASGIDGNSEMIKLTGSGTTYPALDYATAAEQVLMFYKKKMKTKRMSGKSLARFKKEFDFRNVLKQHEKLYLDA